MGGRRGFWWCQATQRRTRVPWQGVEGLAGALEGVCDGGAAPESVEHGRKIEMVECIENGQGGLSLAALVAGRGKPTESIGGVLGCRVE